MSKQIAVRLPDDLVAFVDQVVDDGHAVSRAEVVRRALEREQRRAIAARDAEIYATTEPDEDLERFTAWAAKQPVDLE